MNDGKLKYDFSAYQVHGEGRKASKHLKKSGKQQNDRYKTSSVQSHDTNRGGGGVKLPLNKDILLRHQVLPQGEEIYSSNSPFGSLGD